MKRKVLAMSGGVDNDVAALLVKEAGHDAARCNDEELYDNVTIGSDAKACGAKI